jgi:hypothetical protein
MADPVSFGDVVTIRRAPETEAAGIAGKTGQVFGQTTPSSTGVEVIGASKSDYAINVFFDELNEAYWLAEELVDFVDHGAGTTVTLDGAAKAWVRQADGGWRSQRRKPWWRFWR